MSLKKIHPIKVEAVSCDQTETVPKVEAVSCPN